jgi:hypothetical protein
MNVVEGSFVELYDSLQADIKSCEEGRDKESLRLFVDIVTQIKEAHQKKQRTIRRGYDQVTQGNIAALEKAGFEVQESQKGSEIEYFISW